ncbi:hypothetical protein LRP50_05245 [Enterovibrio sp. ZSDZ42]|uniref:SGNH hydrolase-type esterase domain-containing protein n=1 Tax=Enterovibrio gelatinilyticus TaxID=2899819 RepID=A0ABT5QWY5_9GAMM|nr:hypothetical protein [Enterovibrio sp. ZSDZ42]MDD1792533.1 hypothetical protein [Enterovibrio sp. ZSDZ42]
MPLPFPLNEPRARLSGCLPFPCGDQTIANLKKQYDTIVGVGASITAGVFSQTFQFDTPFRGANFTSSSVPGTTLQFMIDNVNSFTSLASGRTLFIVHAGGNDCSTFLSASGTADDPDGVVLSWDDMSDQHKSVTESRYRELISALKQHGDVALSSLTLRDYKGQVLTSPDPDAIGSGSWNDGVVIPLCEELTPEFFDKTRGRPVFDYYQMVKNNPEMLSVDNVHMGDVTYPADPVNGYPAGPSSHAMRIYMIEKLGSIGAITSSPLPDGFSDRIILNVGAGNSLMGRPPFQAHAVTQEIVGRNTYTGISLFSLKSPNTPVSSVDIEIPGAGYGRNNLNSNSLPWNEGVIERNILCNSLGAELIKLTFHGLKGKSGVIRFTGLHSIGATPDASRSAKVTLTDSEGFKVATYENVAPLTSDDVSFFADVDFNAGSLETVVAVIEPNDGASYAYLGGVQIDTIK